MARVANGRFDGTGNQMYVWRVWIPPVRIQYTLLYVKTVHGLLLCKKGTFISEFI